MAVLAEMRSCRRLLLVLVAAQAQRVLMDDRVQEYVAMRKAAHAVHAWLFFQMMSAVGTLF